ncbi:MAG: lysophospholipid acyltransferase family protein [Bacteroides sp.]|nr:lysophospholipid acyltransferase family protein [Bacteroides sp.]
MIQARHTYTGTRVSNFFSGYMLDKAFRTITLSGIENDDHLPVLMIANHFSWWDGFIQYRLNKYLYKRKFHVMMLEEQLSRHMILNKAGAFSIRKQSRDIIESLQYCMELLNDKNNLVLIFPQGKIESIYTPYLYFEKGLNYLIQHIKNNIQVIFNVNLIDYFSHKQPSLTIYFQKYNFLHSPDIRNIEKDFNDYFHQCKCLQGKI